MSSRCADVIADRLQSREDLLSKIYEAIDDESKTEEICESEGIADPEDFLYELPLGISKFLLVTIHLSTGGPGDWLECHVDEHGQGLFRVVYHYNDWFDHAEKEVETSSSLWRYAEQVVESVVYS